MADYIRREDVRRMVVQLDKYAWTSPVSDERRVTVDVDLVKFGLDRIPAVDVAEVVHGTPVTEVRTRTIVGYHEEIGVLAGDRSTLYRRNMVHVDIPYDCCPVCGATLCSRWHNFCGKCGAKMDGAAE